jgi:lambda family phage portal protein
MRFSFERTLARIGLPGLSMRMAAARIALDEAERAYDMAGNGRGVRGWRPSDRSAADEIPPGLAAMRNRARDLVRNNPWGIKARRQIPAHMVGTGVMPRPTEGADITRRRALRAWTAWSAETDIQDNTDFNAQQALVAGKVFEDGEGFLLWTPAPDVAGGWSTRVLEADYLDETFDEVSRNGSGRIVSGVEFDAAGRRVAYHFWREHPGDALSLRRMARERVRVDAQFVDHVFERLRPGQVRGVPFMAAAGLRLRDLDDYLLAERWRKKVGAAFAAFVTSPNGPAQSSLGQLATETKSDGTRRGIETIAPGSIKRLLPGESVSFSAPPGDATIEAYVKTELMAVAAAIGAPYAEFTGDLRSANYSSMRVGRLEFYVILDAWQSLMIKPMLLRRAWRRVQATGGVPGLPCEWSFPRRPWVDPESEINAEIRAIRAGLTSQPDAIAARGDDWRQVLAEQAEFLAEADGLDLVLDTDPRKTAGTGTAQAAKVVATDANADPAPQP